MAFVSDKKVIKVLRQYNPWWIFPTAIKEESKPGKRLAYYEALNMLKHESIRRFVVLSGVWRVGKTTIMYQIIDNMIDEGVNPRNILYATFDNPIFSFLMITGQVHRLKEILHNETGSIAFYTKCGFIMGRRIKQFSIATDCFSDFRLKNEKVDHVPFSVIKGLPFVFGLSQISSRHMWEVCNEPPENDNRETPAIRTSNGGYIQFSYYKPNDTGLALCWSSSGVNDDLIEQILSFGYECRLKNVVFTFFEGYEDYFRKFNKVKIDEENVELYKFA